MVIDRREWRSARVLENRAVGTRMRLLRLAPDGWITHAAGQHYDLRLPGERLTRTFSVVSSPLQTGWLDFGIRPRVNGVFSPGIADWRPGDPAEIRGPIGASFTWHPYDGGPLVLLGAGAGVTPLLAMRQHFLETVGRAGDSPLDGAGAGTVADTGTHCVLLLSVKAPEHLFLPGVDDPSGQNGIEIRYSGSQGRVDRSFVEPRLATALASGSPHARICGPPAFMEAMVEILLRIGVKASRIRSEAFV